MSVIVCPFVSPIKKARLEPKTVPAGFRRYRPEGGSARIPVEGIRDWGLGIGKIEATIAGQDNTDSNV
jgi:hypothetical protein